VEHLSSLRCIPGLLVLRPADAAETAEAWRMALRSRTGPSAVVLTRQKLPLIDRTMHGAVTGATKGAYVLKDVAEGQSLQAVILASGSEVKIALKAQGELAAAGVATRMVSMVSMEVFGAQDAACQAGVLTVGVKRVAIEASHPMSWYKWVGTDGAVGGDRGVRGECAVPEVV